MNIDLKINKRINCTPSVEPEEIWRLEKKKDEKKKDVYFFAWKCMNITTCKWMWCSTKGIQKNYIEFFHMTSELSKVPCFVFPIHKVVYHFDLDISWNKWFCRSNIYFRKQKSAEIRVRPHIFSPAQMFCSSVHTQIRAHKNPCLMRKGF